MGKNADLARAMANNKNAQAIHDPAIRKKAYKEYCDHLASGYSKDAWYFSDKEHGIGWRTIESYMAKYPDELPPKQLDDSIAAAKRLFEKIGLNMMLDKQAKSEPAIYQMFMRNKFGWDKPVPEKSHTQTAADEILDRINQ